MEVLDLFDLSGFDTGCTYPGFAGVCAVFDPNLLNVWQPSTVRPLVREADLLAVARTFIANFAAVGHENLVSKELAVVSVRNHSTG